ncbi:OmpA family protein [Nonomuraea sp. MCN248]|uniref:OmpA family protein n=1 Tax=Nonomuraea corallina TaxID=2989783 RepID=A0ABT4SLQ5_9ACTN|nr:OmpA family protein [Nonomuraea corallina]MDA0637920.1 OmpA family protein [Nonomuraea corallina]
MTDTPVADDISGKSRPLRLTAAACALVLSTSCGVLPQPEHASSPAANAPASTPAGPGTPQPARDPATPAASASPSSSDPHADAREPLAGALATHAEDGRRTVRADLVGLNRIGDHVAVQVRLTETGERSMYVWHHVWDRMATRRDRGDMASGLGIIDAAAGRLLMPSATPDGGCACTVEDDFDRPWLEPGEPRTFFALVPAPSGGATSATVYTPFAPPFINVPISDDPPQPPPGQRIPDPATAQLTPLSYPMELPSASLDNSMETTTDDQRVRINLSSDVLFKMNKADLSARARDVLKRTAGQIDASDAAEVAIDGHADSTGTDAVNQPLSERRAETVREELASLVTREGVTFRARGHGSAQPLYSNDDADGRRKNRRVTVSFDRPATLTAPSPSGTPSPVESGRPGGSSGTNVKGQPFTVEVDPIRVIGGGIGLMVFRTTNNGIKKTWLHDLNDRPPTLPGRGGRGGPTNVDVVDPVGKTLHGAAVVYSRQGSRGYCLCTSTKYRSDHLAQETKEHWAVVSLPRDASSVRVRVAQFPPLADVPVI